MNQKTKTEWVAVLPAMVLPGLAALIYFVWFSDRSWARWVYAGTKLFTVGWPLACLRILFHERWPRLGGASGRRLRALPAGILSGLVLVGVLLAVEQTSLGRILVESAGRIRGKAEALGILHHYVVFALFLAVAHSFIEEVYWRWFVYGRLRRVCPEPVALGLASGAFAAHHAVIAGQFFPGWWAVIGGLAVMAAGLYWCRLFRKQKTLAGAWASHTIVDLGILWIGYRLLFP